VGGLPVPDCQSGTHNANRAVRRAAEPPCVCLQWPCHVTMRLALCFDLRSKGNPPCCTNLQLMVDWAEDGSYNSGMRIVLVAAILIGIWSPSPAQDIQPDSADTAYVPMDSLNVGLDLALRAMKMTRGDLTFRGDYLEPDVYRLPAVDQYMEEPLELTDYAVSSLRRVDLSTAGEHTPFLGSWQYSCLRQDIPEFDGVREIIDSKKVTNLLPENATLLFKELMEFIEKVDIKNSYALSKYSESQLDSLRDGFTLLLEESLEAEFFSASELDSLEEYEEIWAGKLSKLSANCIGGRYIEGDVSNIISKTEKAYAEKATFQSHYTSWNTDFGQIIIGDTTDNHYTGDLFIVIDPGGDDTYDVEFEGTGHHTYIIDYDGNDTYNMPKNRISPYFFGSNMIIDYDGDDSYNAGSWTLGAGLFGVGLLWDMKGNDRYFGDTFTQGAGCFGVGVLRDDEGNDTYQAALFSQGFGFVDGIGVLLDNSGNDSYFAGGKYKDFIRYNDHYLSLSQGFGYGWRPKMSGGIGMLLDKSGNDVYVSDIYGQGASYWYGLGMLADGGGNDQYISFQYAQGNGTHMSLGILYDVSGDDVYSAKGVSQGCGHDRAAGMLIDLDGDDNYNAYDLCQGAGSANGLGIIADVRGKDVYIVRSDKNTQGYGNPRREYGSIGIFLDLGGRDGYSGGQGRDGHWWTYSKWGAGIDK
jgi:hypothetical protein